MISLQASLDGLGSVVFADGELTAAEVALALDLGGIGNDVEGLAAFLAGPAAGHTLDDDIVGYLNGQGAVNVDARLLQSFCLGNGAGHTVENVTVCTVGLGQTLVNDTDDDIVGDELAALDIFLCTQAFWDFVELCFCDELFWHFFERYFFFCGVFSFF